MLVFYTEFLLQMPYSKMVGSLFTELMSDYLSERNNIYLDLKYSSWNLEVRLHFVFNT